MWIADIGWLVEWSRPEVELSARLTASLMMIDRLIDTSVPVNTSDGFTSPLNWLAWNYAMMFNTFFGGASGSAIDWMITTRLTSWPIFNWTPPIAFMCERIDQYSSNEQSNQTDSLMVEPMDQWLNLFEIVRLVNWMMNDKLIDAYMSLSWNDQW